MDKSESCLLFLYPVIDAAGSGLVCPEQTDRAGPVGIQHVSCFVSDHQVQAQNPEEHRDKLRALTQANKTLRCSSLQHNKEAGSYRFP